MQSNDLGRRDKLPLFYDSARFTNSDLTPAWSPDSKWIAHAKSLRNSFSAVFVWGLENGKATQLTDGMSDARIPVFDKDGKYLYFTASTDIGPALEFDLHAATRPVSRSVYLIVLSKDEPRVMSWLRCSVATELSRPFHRCT